nr:MAG TPA: hypothetical protein [Caudoviricetes sp.]
MKVRLYPTKYRNHIHGDFFSSALMPDVEFEPLVIA